MHYFKSFNRVKSIEDKKMRFFKGNELKLTQTALLSFLHFKCAKSLADKAHMLFIDIPLKSLLLLLYNHIFEKN